MKRWITFAALLIFGLMLAVPPYQASAADAVDVTVRIRCIEQIENPDDASGNGDYFPEVKIGSYDFSTSPDSPGPLGAGPIEDDTFCPDWRFTRSVDPAVPVDIVIKLWDYDDFLNGGNDLMDINPKDQKVELFIRFNALNGTWTDPASDVQGSLARGDGDHGFPNDNDGRITQIDFQVFVGTNPDIDGDGISDAIERNGIRKADGTLVLDLAAAGADPCRKTIIVYGDYMTGAADGHSHDPKAAAITELVNVFDKAPLNSVSPCPYPGTHKAKGVDFIFVKGKSTPEQMFMGIDQPYRDIRGASLPSELRPYAHYVLFAHAQAAGDSSSGLCCEAQDGQRDLLITLGFWHTTCVDEGGDGKLDSTVTGDDFAVVMNKKNTISVGPDLTCNSTAAGDDNQDIAVGTIDPDNQVGSVRNQSSTVMHELGHAMGLGHGGDEKTNYMPNYLSNMNYTFQQGIPQGLAAAGGGLPPRLLDYSRTALGNLDQTKLKESAGIGSALAFWTRWTDPTGTLRWSQDNAAMDWDWSTAINNGSAACGDGTNNCVVVTLNPNDDSKASQTILTGYDDWSNLKYRAVDSPTAGAPAAFPHPDIPDQDFQTVLDDERAFQAAFNPDLTTSKTVDKTDAQGGDVLNYSVSVANIGTGIAANISLTDTFPADQGKTTETRTLANLYPAAQMNEAFDLTVACAAEDGTVLSNSARVTGTNTASGAEANLTNNTASASTTVHAPRLQVTKSASGTGLAGEAITYQVVVSNTGSGSATNGVVTDVLPVDVYYSAALDTGTGPKPTSVTRNANGTTTLIWSLSTLAGSASQTLSYTARTSLLFLGGESVSNAVVVTYKNANGCVFAPVNAAAAITLTVVPPTRDPLSHGYWKTHPEQWQAEILARIQATDQRYDTNADGLLSSAEVTAVFNSGGNMDAITRQQLIATYFNLATRKINAATKLNQNDKLVAKLKVTNLRDAVKYATATLLLPVNSANRPRYSDATTLLDLINNNKIEVY